MKTKLDALNKENAPKLNQFLKRFARISNAGDEKTAYIQGLSVGNQISQQMMPQLSSLILLMILKKVEQSASNFRTVWSIEKSRIGYF